MRLPRPELKITAFIVYFPFSNEFAICLDVVTLFAPVARSFDPIILLKITKKSTKFWYKGDFSIDNHEMLIYNIQKCAGEGKTMSVGANIKKRRFEMRMSQQELADAMGYKTRSTIAKIESGENDVSQKKLQRFAAVLDTTVEALVSGYGNSPIVQAEQEILQEEKNNKNIVIILAGGKTGRNLQNIPTQFMNVQGKPILVYCMEVYQAHPAIDDIYVVCLRGWERIVKAYAKQYGITKLKGLIPAGSSGIVSLKNAVDALMNLYALDDLIMIQEATRPMVTSEMISKLLQVCSEKRSATICHSMKEYVQFDISNRRAKYVDRNTTIALQSPEAHRLSLLETVFEKAAERQHVLNESCCTMLLYNLGFDINFIESNVNNIKITREEDIAAFSAMLRNMN